MVNTVTGLATSFINFSRPGATGGGATVTDRDGKIKWAGHNLLVYSEQIDAWGKSGTTVSANAASAPNGTTTADRLVEVAGGSLHKADAPAVTLASSSAYTYAIFAKADQRSWVAINAYAGANYYTYFNLSSGTVGTNAAGSTAAITSIGNGWYLCTVTRTISSSVTGVLDVYIAESDGTIIYAGDNTKGIFLWGAHLYRSDLGGMQQNPAMPAGMGSYYPTTPRNLLGNTENFTNAAWTKVGAKAFGSGSIANAIAGPNGLQTADFLQENTATDGHGVYYTNSMVAGRYTFSCAVKAAGRNNVLLRFVRATNEYVYAIFDLSAGTVAKAATVAGASISNATAHTPVSLGDGWYRLAITATSSSTFLVGPGVSSCTNANPTISSFGEENYTGDGTSGIYLWGAQLADSASLDAYSPVYGAAVTSAAYYAPRLDYDPVTLAAKGLLVEEARTNLLLHSSAFDNAAWAKGGGLTVNADATTAPDGISTADKIVSANATAQMYVGEQTIAVTSGVTYSQSVFAKAGEYNLVQLRFSNAAFANAEYATFNLTTGAIAQSSGSGHSIIAVGNGWYRCTAVAVATSTTNAFPAVNLATSASGGRNPSITGDGTSGLFLWGAQLEAGSFATSYIPTGSATATRAADVASVSTQAFPYSASEGTLVAAFTPYSVNTNFSILHISDGGNSNRLGSQAGNSEHLRSVVGGVQQVNLDAGGFTAATTAKLGIAFATNDYAAVINGGAVATIGAGGSIASGMNKLDIGSLNNGGQLNGHIRQITYIPRRLTNAELQSRTA